MSRVCNETNLFWMKNSLKSCCVQNAQVFIQCEKNTLIFSTYRENTLICFYLYPEITNSGLD